MRLEYGFTDLLLTSHDGLPAFSYLLKAARLPALFGPSVKTIPFHFQHQGWQNSTLIPVGQPNFKALNATWTAPLR